MGTFLKENWIWIAGPMLVVLAGVGLLLYLSASGDSSSDGEFMYDLM
jgi:hypothetical protein